MRYIIKETQLLFSTNRVLEVSAVKFHLSITGEPLYLNITEAINNTLPQFGLFHKNLLPLNDVHEHVEAKRFVDLVFILLSNTGCDLDQFNISQLSEGLFEIHIQYEDSRLTTMAGELASWLLNLCQTPVDFQSDRSSFIHRELGEFIRYSLIHNQDANAKLLSHAARARNIPVLNLDQPTFKSGYIPNLVMQNGLIQFGYGLKAEKCLGSVPQSFAKVQAAFVFADRSELISNLIRANLPLNTQDPVSSNCNRLSRTLRAAQRVSYPVTLRPSVRREYEYREKNNAVFGPLWSDKQVSIAYAYLESINVRKVAIESFTQGDSYRFLLLKNKVVAISKLTFPKLIGDGIHSVSELSLMQSEQANTASEHLAWKLIATGDAEITTRLAIEELQLDSILEEGRTIALRGHATPYNGGLTEDVTQLMPERFKVLAEMVARVTGLVMLSGIDLIINEISGNTLTPNCVVVDSVAEPDLMTHCKPSHGSAVKVQSLILRELFKKGENGRIPLVAITGTDGKTTTCRMVASILQANHQVVGLACSDGVYINGKEKFFGDHSGISGAFPLLIDETVEIAVLETAQGGLIKYGVAFDACNVGACLNVTFEHIGVNGINTVKQLADVKKQVIQRTTDTIVLNANDTLSYNMRKHSTANSAIYITEQVDHSNIQELCKDSGRIVTIDNTKQSMITIISDKTKIPVIAVSDIPATLNGDAAYNTCNAMFSIAITVGLGISTAVIVKALSQFSMNTKNTPGRLNEITGLSCRVIIDSVHTKSGYKALGSYIQKQNVTGKKILVFGWHYLIKPLIKAVTEEMTKIFDIFVLRKSPLCKHSNMIDILEAELIVLGVRKDNIYKEPQADEAIKLGISLASHNDFVLITTPPSGDTKWKFIEIVKELRNQ